MVEGEVAASLKSTSTGPPKRKKAASSSKRHASSTSVAAPNLSKTDEVEEVEEPSPVPLKKRRKSRTELEPTPEVALMDLHPSRSEDVPTSWTGIASEFENSQVPLEAPSTTAYEGNSFDEVAREALKAAEEIFREEDTLATLLGP